MNRTIKTALCLVLVWKFGSSTYAGETPQPITAAEDARRGAISFQEEAQRIRTLYKDDLPKLTEELRALNKKRAEEMGLGEDLRRRERLRQKYGPVTDGIDVDSEESKFGKTIDLRAWSAFSEKQQGRLHIYFYLDKRRYKDVVPQTISVQLRQKGRTDEEEHLLARGIGVLGTLRIDLAYQQQTGGVYFVSMSVPDADMERLVLQIVAGIEPGWATLANLPLKTIAPSK